MFYGFCTFSHREPRNRGGGEGPGGHGLINLGPKSEASLWGRGGFINRRSPVRVRPPRAPPKRAPRAGFCPGGRLVGIPQSLETVVLEIRPPRAGALRAPARGGGMRGIVSSRLCGTPTKRPPGQNPALGALFGGPRRGYGYVRGCSGMMPGFQTHREGPAKIRVTICKFAQIFTFCSEHLFAYFHS